MVKPERSWTSMPNLIGDQKTVEELCSSGDAGRDIAAFGCIASAFNSICNAESQPADPQFFYPTSRMFPFDEVTGLIVKALKKKEFAVPGIVVKIDSYGPSHSYKMVRTIEGDDFKLWFCRVQRQVGAFNDTAAVMEMTIPGKELSVFDDNSGPSLDVYVGDNWERDKNNFFHTCKVNSKLNGKPRTYLKYAGSFSKTKQTYVSGTIAPFLLHDNDLNREYDPIGREARYYKTKDIFNEFTSFLNKKLLEIRKL